MPPQVHKTAQQFPIVKKNILRFYRKYGRNTNSRFAIKQLTVKIEQNIKRLEHLLTVYNMTADDLLLRVNEGLKRPITREDIFSREINLKHLKRIDKIFHKGFLYYLDSKEYLDPKDASVFLRKSKFAAEPNFRAKRIVHQFEDYKLSLAGIANLAGLNIARKLPVYTTENIAKNAGLQLRKELAPNFNTIPKKFLQSFITILAEKNILIFEFIEPWNKKEKANMDVFYIAPNVIVLKKKKKLLRKQIFTLIHEFAHYMLNHEEIEEVTIEKLETAKMDKVEKWCNDFAYYFLVGEIEVPYITENKNVLHPLSQLYLAQKGTRLIKF